jgi:hypothetical protein
MNKILRNLSTALMLVFGTGAMAQSNPSTHITQISGGSSYLVEPYSVLTTSGGTSYLTKQSRTNQIFTGSSSNTLVLPNATTLEAGRYFNVSNRSTGTITVQYNDLSTAKTLLADSQGKFLVRTVSTSNGTWDVENTVSTIDLSNPSQISGVLASGYGGVGYSSYASGDILYASGGSLVKLAIGSSGYVLTSSGGYPSWQSGSGGGSSLPAFVSGYVLTNDNTNSYWVSGASWFANPGLSNLGSTAVNNNIVPDSTSTRSLGDSAGNLRWQNIWGNFINTPPTGSIGLREAGTTNPIMTLAPATAPDGTANSLLWRGSLTTITSYPAIGLATRSQSTQKILIQTGNGNGVTNSEAIYLRTGAAAGFSQGEINLEASRVTLNNVKLVSMAEPTNISDAATKNYVDTQILAAPSFSSGAASVLAPGVVSINAASTIDPTYSVILANGGSGSFTITFVSTASYANNQLITVVKTDTSPSVISLAGSITGHPLYTPEERFEFQNYSSNFIVSKHIAKYSFNPEVISVSGVVTDPNKGTSSTDQVKCTRDGSELICDYWYVSTSNGTNGSGTYNLKLPSYVSGQGIIDSTRTLFYTGTTVGQAYLYKMSPQCSLNNNSSFDDRVYLYPFDGTRMRLVGVGLNSFWGSGTIGFAGTLNMHCAGARIPITNWENNK